MTPDEELLKLERRLKEDPNDRRAQARLHSLRLATDQDYAKSREDYVTMMQWLEKKAKMRDSLATMGSGSIMPPIRTSGAIGGFSRRRHGA